MLATQPKQHNTVAAFSAGAVIGTLGGLIGLGGAEFRLPLLIGLFGFGVAPQLTVVTSTIARSGVAMLVKDAHAASVVPREAAAPAMTVVRASSSNGR